MVDGSKALYIVGMCIYIEISVNICIVNSGVFRIFFRGEGVIKIINKLNNF